MEEIGLIEIFHCSHCNYNEVEAVQCKFQEKYLYEKFQKKKKGSEINNKNKNTSPPAIMETYRP